MAEFFKQSPEHIPTPTEVLELISRYAEKLVPLRELSDAQGLYLLEALAETDANSTDKTVYQYMRKGRYADKNESSETAIYSIIYENGLPIGGEKIAYLDAASGWITC